MAANQGPLDWYGESQQRVVGSGVDVAIGTAQALVNYGRTVSQDAEPTEQQLREGEWCFWIDTNDADRLYLCRRAGGVVKKTELV